MKVDPKTLMFEDMTDEEATEMQKVVEDIVMRGTIPLPMPEWARLWMEAAGYRLDDEEYLSVMGRALPQRVLLSLLRRNENRHLKALTDVGMAGMRQTLDAVTGKR